MERETLWWNEAVPRDRGAGKQKGAHKRWLRTQNEEEKREYKEKAKQAKKEVARAKSLVWESWSEELNSSGQQKEMFKIVKQIKKDKKRCNWTKVYKG